MHKATLIDSHCHLNYLQEEGGETIEKIVAKARARGVEKFLCIGVDVEHIPEVLAIAESFPEVKASVGIHPCSVPESSDSDLLKIADWLSHKEVLALGETGLDYYRPEGLDKSRQKRFFAEHIQLSLSSEKPLIVHTRAAREDTIDLLRTEGAFNVQGVLHCFTETKEMARMALDLGLYISFSGIITFKNASELREVVEYVPMDRLLVETDSPYLAPVPYRGKQNQPAYVLEVAEAVASIKKLPFEQVAQKTTENTLELFRWDI